MESYHLTNSKLAKFDIDQQGFASSKEPSIRDPSQVHFCDVSDQKRPSTCSRKSMKASMATILGGGHQLERQSTKDISYPKLNEAHRHSPRSMTVSKVWSDNHLPSTEMVPMNMTIHTMRNRYTRTSTLNSIAKEVLDHRHRLFYKVDRSRASRQNY